MDSVHCSSIHCHLCTIGRASIADNDAVDPGCVFLSDVAGTTPVGRAYGGTKTELSLGACAGGMPCGLSSIPPRSVERTKRI